MRPLLALVFIGTGLAQQCLCDSDDVRGYWTGGSNCTACNLFGAPLDLTISPPGGSACTLKDTCRDVNRPLNERTCFGVGRCLNSVAQPCNCSFDTFTYPHLAGRFCEQCATGWKGWPSCTTPVCVAPLTNSPTCNSHGTCSDVADLACGVAGVNCRENVLDPVCNPVSYNPQFEMCQGLGAGLTTALTLGPGQTACGGGTCNFGTTCANPNTGTCCKKDETACHARAANAPTKTVCCHPSQVCCEGVCCSSSQKCAAIVDRRFTVSPAMVSDGGWGGGAWTDWKMQDGSTAEPWKMCSTEFLGAVSTTRVIILPIGLTIGIIIALVLIWQATGLKPLSVTIPGVILVFCAIFLFFSRFWTTAVVFSLAALFTIGAGHKGGNAFLVAIVIQFFALAVVCGGLGLGAIWYDDNTPDLFFQLTGSHTTNWNILSSCSGYYDYFVVDTTTPSAIIPGFVGAYSGNVPYTADPALQYRDYCGEGWYTYISLVADIVVTFQIIMVVLTGVAYLNGGSGGGKNLQ